MQRSDSLKMHLLFWTKVFLHQRLAEQAVNKISAGKLEWWPEKMTDVKLLVQVHKLWHLFRSNQLHKYKMGISWSDISSSEKFLKAHSELEVNLSSWCCIKDKHYIQAHAEEGILLTSQPSLWQAYCLLPLVTSSLKISGSAENPEESNKNNQNQKDTDVVEWLIRLL